MLAVTPIYASLLTFLFLWLSYRVVLGRRTLKISIGDGDDKAMIKRMRVQANAAEYIPFGILMMAFAEFQGMPAHWLHACGVLFLLGRVLHAIGLGSTPQRIWARFWGMWLTIGILVLLALSNLFHALY